ncbi:MAG: flagellar hook-basal body protein [Eubacteriales bacterium]|nr:flagellar hook-basal body protein [Eubacteriales bacterium]
MLQSNFSAKSAILAQQQRLDVIANNIANLSTGGYKSSRVDFKDMVYETMQRNQAPQDDLNMERGSGVLLGATTKDFRPGTAQMTGDPSHLMLSGDGFFTVLDKSGQKAYTRSGATLLSVEGAETYLVNGDGNYYVSAGGEKIRMTGADSMKNVIVNTDGTVSVRQVIPATATAPASETIEVRGKLGVASFINRKGLDNRGGNLYYASAVSGEAKEDTATEIQQGMLESSNVDMATEMTRLIRAQRAFSFASRALTTADEMDGKANQLR